MQLRNIAIKMAIVAPIMLVLLLIVSLVEEPVIAQVDRFSAELRSLLAPATDAFSPTLSDSVNQTTMCRAFIAETAGTVKVTTMDGTTLTFTMQAGQQINLRIKRFWSTGTTATVKCLVRVDLRHELNRKVTHDAPPLLALEETHRRRDAAAAIGSWALAA